MLLSDKDILRLISKIRKGVKPTDCWEWCGSKCPRGYGRFAVSANGVQRKTGAHRASYLAFCGYIPNGLMVCHSCDNRSCVNPRHLWLGDAKDNMDDMHQKGRGKLPVWECGEKNKASKLLGSQVAYIKLLLKHGYGGAQIARWYGVKRACISFIKVGQTWAHEPMAVLVRALPCPPLEKEGA